jgi:hypothetical protein
MEDFQGNGKPLASTPPSSTTPGDSSTRDQSSANSQLTWIIALSCVGVVCVGAFVRRSIPIWRNIHFLPIMNAALMTTITSVTILRYLFIGFLLYAALQKCPQGKQGLAPAVWERETDRCTISFVTDRWLEGCSGWSSLLASAAAQSSVKRDNGLGNIVFKYLGDNIPGLLKTRNCGEETLSGYQKGWWKSFPWGQINMEKFIILKCSIQFDHCKVRRSLKRWCYPIFFHG